MIINQQKVEKAIVVLENLKEKYPKGFPNEMKGDISSFGASIIQAGLLPSVLFFSEGTPTLSEIAEDDTKERRANLMKAVFEVMDVHAIINERSLLQYVRQNLSNLAGALDNISEAALAVTVALRAFKFEEKESKPSNSNNPTT